MAEGEEDSRPFSVLKQNAEDFKALFDKDTKLLLDALDSRITNLLQNPELGTSSTGDAVRLNAHMEFSRAKLDIFLAMKEQVGKLTEQWMEHLADIRDTFVENVEIFLAGTKLEVKEDTSSRKSSKERKKTPLFPKILAKNIPVLNSLLSPKTDDHSKLQTASALKPIQKQSALPEVDSNGPGRKKNSVRFAEDECTENVMEMVEEVQESSDSEVQIVEAPVKKRRGRPAAANKPTSLRKAVAVRAEVLESPVKLIDSSIRGSRRGPATPSSAKKATLLKNETEVSSDSSISGEESATEKSQRGARVKTVEPIAPRSVTKAKRGAKMAVTEEVVTPVRGTPGRRGRKAAASSPEPVIIAESPPKPVSPESKNFPNGLDLNEDLEIFSPVVNITRSAPRRKTVILEDLGFTPEVPKPKSKRKTIGGDLSGGTPSKRSKMSARNSLVPQEMEESDHLEGDNSTTAGGGKYCAWLSLSEVGGAVTGPGVYELKVSQAKKPAYIGSCENVRQRLTLHRLRHAPSGTSKHLDKFVERNAANLLVRYEPAPTLDAARALEKARVAAFTALHNTTPAYN